MTADNQFETVTLERLRALEKTTSRVLWIVALLAEVLHGFRDELQCRRTRRWFSRLAYADLAGREVALQAATNYRLLRHQGVTVRKTIDMLIATFCIRNGHSLLYTDRDFAPMVEHLGLLKA